MVEEAIGSAGPALVKLGSMVKRNRVEICRKSIFDLTRLYINFILYFFDFIAFSIFDFDTIFDFDFNTIFDFAVKSNVN